MTFGTWDNLIHKDIEQVKRIEKAKKPDVSPSAVDYNNKCAEFKGSGKEPYYVSLDSCTCGDYMRRRLPCKHIYRLALELSGGDVQRGINKNEYESLASNVFKLPVESQELLYEMCVGAIYHKKNMYVFERNEFSENLFRDGYCVQSVPSVKILSNFTVSEIKWVLFTFNMTAEELPKPNSQKKTLVKWLDEHFDLVLADIDRYFVFLEFEEHIGNIKHKIHRGFTKKFERVATDCVDGFYSESLRALFTQEL